MKKKKEREQRRNAEKYKMNCYTKSYDEAVYEIPDECKPSLDCLDALACISGDPLETAENGFKAGFIKCMEFLKGSGPKSQAADKERTLKNDKEKARLQEE